MPWCHGRYETPPGHVHILYERCDDYERFGVVTEYNVRCTSTINETFQRIDARQLVHSFDEFQKYSSDAGTNYEQNIRILAAYVGDQTCEVYTYRNGLTLFVLTRSFLSFAHS